MQLIGSIEDDEDSHDVASIATFLFFVRAYGLKNLPMARHAALQQCSVRIYC
jgi:hypothetical protein